MDNKKILETLQMQPLSEEEKSSRKILGRLYGPIATSLESTRNGRKYNRQLWENALKDEVFNEKIANKCLFLELGHPADREEIDMRQVCACIPEVPKIVDGDLYAYVDILDTANGRILKTLCDYGFVPGISSRGSGDIMDNDEVDPDTFFLETFDIVAIPAVKKARLAMCESLDKNNIKLSAKLAESLNNASEEDKVIMKESLEKLNIKLTEDMNEEEVVETEVSEEDVVEPEEVKTVEDDDQAVADAAAEEEDSAEDIVNDIDDEESDDEEPEDGEVTTVKEFIESFGDLDENAEIEFAPIVIGDQEYEISGLNLDLDDGKVTISIDYNEADEAEDNIEDSSEDDDEPSEESTDDVAAETEEEAIDDEIDEVMESLKEVVRQKNALEEELSAVKQSKTVSDAEVEELKKQVTQYKESFARVSELASKAKKFEKENLALTEKLQNNNDKIRVLESRITKAESLNESSDINARKLARVTEAYKSYKIETENSTRKLEEQCNQYAKKVTEVAKVANSYKAMNEAILNDYIESKAAALGVHKSDITSKLTENYSIKDIDAACDALMDCTMNMSRLPFNTRKTRVQMQESTQNKKTKVTDPDFGYEIDDDLLTLAGLK